jgi:hypothetical protein
MIDPFTKKDKERFTKAYDEIRNQVITSGESGPERVNIDPKKKRASILKPLKLLE